MKAVRHNRETLIALRARRQAQRIARDIMLPHVEVPRPVLPDTPLPPPDPTRYDEPEVTDPLPLQILAALFCLLSVMALIYVATHK